MDWNRTRREVHKYYNRTTEKIRATPNILLGVIVISVVAFFLLTPSIGELRLRASANKYIADTHSEAKIIAKQLEPGSKNAGNICGPLAITILKDAGMLPDYVDPHDFWLLQPRDDSIRNTTLEEAFPRSEYHWYRALQSIREISFVKFPLRPGDFVYLYAGHRGTYDHIFVVTRVDIFGRAYTVTNELTEDGFKITEKMLYNPFNKKEGYFYRLTDMKYNWTLGTTGFGGFELWREK
jgi:hypothetical protein